MRSLVSIWLAATVFWMAGLSTAPAKPLEWPREIQGAAGGSITLYQPQVDRWDNFISLEFRLAAALKLPGRDDTIPAALKMAASTTTDLADRTVLAYDLKVVDVDVSSPDETIAARLSEFITEYVSGMTQTLSLDTVLAHFEKGSDRERPKPTYGPSPAEKPVAELKVAPPKIMVSYTPSILVLFDGEPLFVDAGTGELEFAVNTNWDILHHVESSTYYLLYEESWLKASDVTGPWVPARKLPRKIAKKIPDNDSFKSVREHVPGEKLSDDEAPKAFVSFEPAELIYIKGRPVEDRIPGTDLIWISNTDSNLIRHASSREYYYLVSGRWFRAKTLQGPWVPANAELPKDFAAIPKSHPAAVVRVSVKGTDEADEAVMLANIPQKAEVRRSDTTVVITYDGDPKFVKIDGTSVYYATNTAFDVFRVGSKYYVCFNGVWFVAKSPTGVWVVSDDVPAAIYKIPPSSPKYHVTYVRVYDSSPDVVVVGYTSGYTGVYVSGGVVVYGTGYYYSPYIYYPPVGYPVYRAYPCSYGVAAYYSPYTGGYARGAAVYGPYGGAGWGAAYNPQTGTYARGVSAWGPYESGYARQAYNPRTDTYGASYQRSTPYASWGESVVTRGDEWVRTGNYSDSRGSVAGVETSKGGKAGAVQTDQGTAYAGRDADNNLYAGKDGNVYKRSDDGWSSYSDGTWQAVERPEASSEAVQERQSTAESKWSDRSGTVDSLERDWKARESASQRSRNFESFRSGRSRSSSRGSRSRRGRRGN